METWNYFVNPHRDTEVFSLRHIVHNEVYIMDLRTKTVGGAYFETPIL